MNLSPASVDEPSILSVTALTQRIREHLESAFSMLWVQGELSGVKYHSSGHCYLSLKDEGAQINCTLWRSRLARMRFRPETGQKVIIRGNIGVYPPRGTYSLDILQMELQGIGNLQMAFEQLKRRLAKEGLFDQERKRPIPRFVNRVGIVTSATGAALQDMLKVMFRRNPHTTVIVSHARVQGDGAALEIAHGIRRLCQFGEVDVIIVGRGGGSMEDLWAFNEEVVAKAIAASPIPIVSAVGHEVDFTIADFAADLRAPTPSAAAELVIRDREELKAGLSHRIDTMRRTMTVRLSRSRGLLLGLSERLRDPRRHVHMLRDRLDADRTRLIRAPSRTIAFKREQLDARRARLALLSPRARIRAQQASVKELENRLTRAYRQKIAAKGSAFQQAMQTLEALSPLQILSRGYAIASRRKDGRIIRSSTDIDVGETLFLRVHEGRLLCRVEAKDSQGGDHD